MVWLLRPRTHSLRRLWYSHVRFKRRLAQRCAVGISQASTRWATDANARNKMNGKTHTFYPRPVLAFGYCRCLCLPVCASVCAVITSFSARQLINVQVRITKFGPCVLKTLVKVPIVSWRKSTLTFKVKFNLKLKIYPILSLSTPQLITIQARITKFEPDVRNI